MTAFVNAFKQVPVALVASGLAFAVFSLMAAGGVTWMDPGELTAAGYTLGGSHPPGHPGHSLLVKLATLVPIGEIAFRAALLSSLAAAIAIAGAYRLATVMVPGQSSAAIAGVVLVILSPVGQVNATRAEVYAPTAALVIWAMVATLQFVRKTDSRDFRLPLLAALACGLAAAFHPVIAAAAAVPMAIAIVHRAAKQRLRTTLRATLCGAIGLVCYAYLPVRANAEIKPLLMWGDPSSLSDLLEFVRAPAYQGNFGTDGILDRFSARMLLLGEGMGLGLLFAGLTGLAFGAITQLRGAAIIFGTIVSVVLGAALQDALNPDMPGYVLPALLLLPTGLAIIAEGVARLVSIPPNTILAKWVGPVIVIPFVAAGLAGSKHRVLDAGFRDSEGPLQLWGESIGLAPPGPGVYFANSDHTLFPALYERIVAGGRPDLAIANAELCRDRWFLRLIKEQRPELHVPGVDDDSLGSMDRRLVAATLKADRLVAGFEPSFDRLNRGLKAWGRGYVLPHPRRVQHQAEHPATLPPEYRGDIGARVSGQLAVIRGLYEANHGRLAAAAIASGAGERFETATLDELAKHTPNRDRPALYGFVPRVTPVFIFEPWQRELFADDLAWSVGASIPALPASAAIERRVHAQWREILRGDRDAAAPLEPDTAQLDLETASMLTSVGHLDKAERFLQGAIARRGETAPLLLLVGIVLNSGDSHQSWVRAEIAIRRASELAPGADAFAFLGNVLVKLNRKSEAAQAYRRALQYEPRRANIRHRLNALESE